MHVKILNRLPARPSQQLAASSFCCRLAFSSGPQPHSKVLILNRVLFSRGNSAAKESDIAEMDSGGSGPKLILILTLIVACLLPFAPYLIHFRTLSLHPVFFPLSCVIGLALLVAVVYSVFRCTAVEEEARRERALGHLRGSRYHSSKRWKQ